MKEKFKEWIHNNLEVFTDFFEKREKKKEMEEPDLLILMFLWTIGLIIIIPIVLIGWIFRILKLDK